MVKTAIITVLILICILTKKHYFVIIFCMKCKFIKVQIILEVDVPLCSEDNFQEIHDYKRIAMLELISSAV